MAPVGPETWDIGADDFSMASICVHVSIDMSGSALGTASLPKLRSSADAAATDCCSRSQDARRTSGDGRIRSSQGARVERADCSVGDLWPLDHKHRLNFPGPGPNANELVLVPILQS